MMRWYHIMTGQFGYPQPASDFGYLSNTYDSTKACPTCQIGLRQRGEFRFRIAPNAKHSQFLGLNWVFDEIFVREVVKDIFEREGITGIEFSQPVIHKTGLPVPGIYQLRVNNVLLDGLLPDNLTSETCELPKNKGILKFLSATNSKLAEGPFCGKVKYNYPQGDQCIRIRAQAMENRTDFLRLGDYFGSGASSNRPIVISENVKQVIDREKWRGAFLRVVELV